MDDTPKDPRHFADELEDLKQRVVAMGRLVEDRLETALHALTSRDVNLARTVAESDSDINNFQVEIDRRCFTLLALHQPMAIDLRTIVAAAKINGDLERVGDLTVNIAEAIERYLCHPPIETPVDLPRMADLARSMLHDALDSFVSAAVAVAQRVLDRDDELDEMTMEVFRDLLGSMLHDADTIEAAVNLVLVSRHLERVGDHATNIAEDVIFMVAARDVRHVAAL